MNIKLFSGLCLLLVGACSTINPAAAQTPTVITIQLQGGPNSKEPVQQPARIRVDDRSPVRLHIVNLSPLDLCSVTRTPAPTPENNPFESLITSISSLGAMSIATNTQLNAAAEGVHMTFDFRVSPLTTSRTIEDDPDYKRLERASREFQASAAGTTTQQLNLKATLFSRSQDLLKYLGADYRVVSGTSTTFDPETTADLANLRTQISQPIETILTASTNQADLDAFNASIKKFHTTWDTDGHPETLKSLRELDRLAAKLTALMSVINANNKTLADSQTKLQAAYDAALQLKVDFNRRQTLGIIQPQASAPGTVFFQDIDFGSDRKATVTGTLTCVSATDGKTPTTDTINYSILYEDVPTFSASAGFLVSGLEKKIIGIANQSLPGASSQMIFAVTDRAQAQMVPMAFLNYRFGSYRSYKSVPWGRTRETELVYTFNLSAGFGVNPNSGTPQPEFFVGAASGLNRLMLHPGLDFGRTQSLGGGFTLNTMVPTTLTNGIAPINWSYHPAISIGFSVRVAP